MTKRYVSVIVRFGEDGTKEPQQILLDNKKYNITKVLETKNCASLKVGGIGQRYKVKINNTQTYLFYDAEESKWFVEFKN